MSYLPVLIYVHILLMVFWVGTDIGVFVSALRYIDPRRSILERASVMNLGMVVDRYPRICFVAMLPVGLQIGWLIGLVPLSAGVMALVWAAAAVWMASVIALMVLSGRPAAKPWHFLERVFLVGGMLTFIGLGLAGLLGWFSVPRWLAGKLTAYGAICFFGLSLEHSFTPVVAAFSVIESEGSTPERESVLRRCMMRSLAWVLAIYAAVLTAGFLGTVKP